jgi:hypothetical protein
MNKTNTSETATPESAKAGRMIEGVLAIIRNGAPRSDDERLWLAQLYKTLAPDTDCPTVRAVGHHVLGVLKVVDGALAEMPPFPAHNKP